MAKPRYVLLFITLTLLTRQTEINVILSESGQDEDRKRYTVVLTPANKIDMNAIVEYCQGAKQSEKTKDIAASTLYASWATR